MWLHGCCILLMLCLVHTCMMVLWCFSSDLKGRNLVWVEELSKNPKEHSNRIGGIEKPYGSPYGGVYGSSCSHQNLMKPILDETRHPKLSIHINYKAIILVLREIWFFEVYLGILYSILGSMGCEGYNSPYITRKWVKRILLESLHIEQHPIKISELNSVPIAPSNSINLP